jgi:hypothetical protein
VTSTTNTNTNTKTSKTTAVVVVITPLPSSLLDQKIDEITAEPHSMPLSCELGTNYEVFPLLWARISFNIYLYTFYKI